MAAVYRVTCGCGGFAVATLSEYEARKFRTFHANLNSDREAGIHDVKIMALANENRPAQAILEAYTVWATAGVPA
jgi:hypothetical protein